MTVDLVIFDCDGVLIDSEPIVNRAHARTLTECGYLIGDAQLIERFCGVSDKDMLAAIELDRGQPLPADYPERVGAIIRREYETSLKPIDGVAAVLAEISLPVCVASSSAPAQIRRGLAATGLLDYFTDNIFSASMVVRGKPAPDLFLHAASCMATPASRCVVVEDSIPGVTAAVAAEMTAIGFCGGGHCLPGHDARLAAHGATLVIKHMAELLPALDRLLR